MIFPIKNLPIAEAFTLLIDGEMAAGNIPYYYDTNPNSKVMDETIDVDSSERSWTWQYCTEFGYFQTVSKMHRMRPFQVDLQYWRDGCQYIFPALDYNETYPMITYTEDQYGGGNKMDGTNIFFTNGSEDPWKWVTQLQDRPELNQRSRVSECIGCAHCADLYTPQESDPQNLKDTRQMVYDWLTEILDGVSAPEPKLQ